MMIKTRSSRIEELTEFVKSKYRKMNIIFVYQLFYFNDTSRKSSV